MIKFFWVKKTRFEKKIPKIFYFYFIADKRIIIFFLVLSSIFFAAKVNSTIYTERGVIMVPKTEVRSGPSTTYTALLKINTGTCAEITQRSNDWFQIRLENGYQGWITQSAIELI